MIYILFVFGSLTLPCFTNSEHTNKTFENSVVCRACGNDISSTKTIISKPSPVSSNSFTEAVFNDSPVLIQLLSKDIFEFHVITSSKATCDSFGEWQEDDTWYPGYHWKPCTCPECGTFVGWIFKSSDTVILHPRKFYGLILASIISESMIDNLTVYPKI